jgi:hypothetical protein
MRNLIPLALLCGFTLAVILPNEFGTLARPALDGKVLTKERLHSIECPSHGAAGNGWLPHADSPGKPSSFGGESVVWRSVRTSIIVNLCLPLLI